MHPNNIIELNSYYGIVKILGNDPAKFLQGQLTCDVYAVTENNPIYGCYCDHKGRVEAIFWVFKIGADYYLRLPRSIITQTIQELLKYAVFSKIQITEVSLDLKHYGIIGHLHTQTNVLHFDYSKLGIPNLHEVLSNSSLATNADLTCWQKQLINSRLAEIYPATIGCFLPHNLELKQLTALNFTKGCYRGQEIIARMEHLGSIKYGLAVAVFNNEPNPKLNSPVYNQAQQIIGKVVNCVDGLLLLQVQKEFLGNKLVYDNGIISVLD